MVNFEQSNSEHNNYSEIYRRFCSHLDKEDDLINNRINWLLVSQTLLFATLGLAKKLNIILNIIPWVGVLSSLVVLLSIIAAILTFSYYFKQLKKVCNPNEDPEGAFALLHRKGHNIALGFTAPVLLPVVFVIAWIYMIFQL